MNKNGKITLIIVAVAIALLAAVGFVLAGQRTTATGSGGGPDATAVCGGDWGRHCESNSDCLGTGVGLCRCGEAHPPFVRVCEMGAPPQQ